MTFRAWSRRAVPPLLLGVACAALYLTFRSASLDDFDAYSFALALERFSLALQQPQPPGFPIYVVLGRLGYALAGDPVAALTGLGALSGVGAVLVVYALGRALDPAAPATAALAAVWVALVPMGWLTAEKALSDTLGLLATLLALWLLWRATRPAAGPRALALAGLACGLSLGVRPQNALPLVMLGVAWLVDYGRHHGRQRPLPDAGRALLALAGGGAVGVLLWLLPTARAVGGWGPYLAHLRGHAAHVGRADALVGSGLPPVAALRARALAFADTFLLSTVGVGAYARWTPSEALRCAALGAIVAVGVVRADWRRRTTWTLAAWTLAMAAQVYFFEALDRPRLLVPLLPPLALLVAHGWARWRRPSWPASLLLAGTGVALLAQGAPLAATLATVPAPPAQATAYVAARYPAEATLVVAAGSFRAAQVDLPDYRLLYLYRFDGDAARAALAEGVRYIVILDRDKVPQEVLALLHADDRYVPLEDRTFARDRRVHTQHDRVRVQVLTPADQVPAAALRPPPAGCVDVGHAADGRYLGQGWFRPETIGAVPGRWAGGTLTTSVRLALPPDQGYEVRFRALAYPPGQTVTVGADGRALATLPLAGDWAEYAVHLPAAFVAEGVTTLTWAHAAARSPFAATDGGSSDRRALTAAYDWICVSPLP